MLSFQEKKQKKRTDEVLEPRGERCSAAGGALAGALGSTRSMVAPSFFFVLFFRFLPVAHFARYFSWESSRASVMFFLPLSPLVFTLSFFRRSSFPFFPFFFPRSIRFTMVEVRSCLGSLLFHQRRQLSPFLSILAKKEAEREGRATGR